MLLFGAIADRFGRRRVMLIGLVLLALASTATAFVTTAEQLIAVRAAMGVAAAMTTPGSMALAFRLFDEESLRVRAITLISTVGLVGLAIGPTVGGPRAGHSSVAGLVAHRSTDRSARDRRHQFRHRRG